MLMWREGCIFYELSNAWQVNDTMYSDILAIQVMRQLDHQVCNSCSSLNCSCSWMLNLLKFPVPKAILKYTRNAFSLGALLAKRLTLLHFFFFFLSLLRQTRGSLGSSCLGLETLVLCRAFG